MRQEKKQGSNTSILSPREQEFLADREWALNDREIRRKHAGKVIAVCDKTIIAHAKTITDLKTKISRLDNDDSRRYRLVIVAINGTHK